MSAARVNRQSQAGGAPGDTFRIITLFSLFHLLHCYYKDADYTVAALSYGFHLSFTGHVSRVCFFFLSFSCLLFF